MKKYICKRESTHKYEQTNAADRGEAKHAENLRSPSRNDHVDGIKQKQVKK